MEEIVIKVENLNKKFCRSLKRSMAYGAMDLVRNFLGTPTDQSKLRKAEFWALENINFELKKGEILGVIGVNGSGKSTLLRILSGIFPPDTGKVEVKGKIGALIAVGAGFHPHFTGRENIYLNGTVLGMTKSEIDDKFNEIINFADIGDFLDAPVSTYSSGMKVRLGFAVAIHSVPEVLLVDEVLAVGDISFRKKCMQKMEEIKKKCSIIFISHNMNQIERICDKVVLLDKGKMLYVGSTKEGIDKYYNLTIAEEAGKRSEEIQILDSTGDIRDLEINVENKSGEQVAMFNNGDDIVFKFSFFSQIEINNPILGAGIENAEGVLITSSKNIDDKKNRLSKINKGQNTFYITFQNMQLLPNTYRLYFKWKMPNNTSLIEARGGSFGISSNPGLLTFDGVIKTESKWN